MFSNRSFSQCHCWLLLEVGADANKTGGGERTPLWEAAFRGNVDGLKLVLQAGALVNEAEQVVAVAGDTNLVQSGSIVNKRGSEKYQCRNAEVAKLVFAAGEIHVIVSRISIFRGPTRYFPPDWDGLDLKNQCRKFIRKHLLTLDPHTNLFIRVPQLQMTDEKPGLPRKLASYLLYHQNLEVVDVSIDTSSLTPVGSVLDQSLEPGLSATDTCAE